MSPSHWEGPLQEAARLLRPGTPMEFRPPVTLEGRYIRLLPLASSHAPALSRAGADPEIWKYMPYGPRTTESAMAELIATLLERQSTGSDLAFTTVDRSTGEPIGMTRFLSIDRPNRAVEVGGTWLAPAFRRSPANTEAKRLLLGHAFDQEAVHRVQLRTDLRNDRSQRAIERLGAVREGVLREHLRMPDGYVRSSVCYSILEDEWPGVRDRLDQLLARPWTPPSPGPGTSDDASP